MSNIKEELFSRLEQIKCSAENEDSLTEDDLVLLLFASLLEEGE